jgi:hypothetical protein
MTRTLNRKKLKQINNNNDKKIKKKRQIKFRVPLILFYKFIVETTL